MTLNRQTRILYFSFFLSGTAALICEIVWNRMLILAVGNTVRSASLVIMTFMAGLAWGSYAGGRWFQHRRTSIWPYIVTQTGLAVFTAISPDIFKRLPWLISTLNSSLSNLTLIDFSQLLVTATALLIPTFFMGLSYPAVILAAKHLQEDEPIQPAGYLYALNTLGGSLGCYLAAFVLLPLGGTHFSLYLAALLNLGAAALAGILKYRYKLYNARNDTLLGKKTRLRAADKNNLPAGTFIIVVFLSGFAGLAYQILMIRFIILLMGNQIQVFGLVVSAFLLAYAISAAWASYLLKYIKNSGWILIAAIFLSAWLMVLSPVLLMALPDLSFRFVLGTGGFHFLIWLTTLLPILVMGSLFPLAIALYQSSPTAGVTRNAAILYSANSLGAVAGAGLTNHYLIPLFGSQGTVSVLASFCITLVIFLGFKMQATFRRRLVTGIILTGCLVAIMAIPSQTKDLFVSVITDQDRDDYTLQWFQEGRAATLIVLDSQNDSRRLFINGVEEVTSRFYHVRLFKALGLLPVLLHDRENELDVLVIAFGAGITSGAVLDAGGVRRADAVDINPDIQAINRLFSTINGNVLGRPNFHFIHADGRRYLDMRARRYPIIIADSTHPAAYDSWTMYTREFLEKVRRNLTADGIFVQWIPLTISKNFFRIYLNTFHSVFEHCTFWNIPGSDQAFLLATARPFHINARRFQERLERMPDSAQLAIYDLDRLEFWAGLFVLDTPGIKKAILLERRLNTDDYPFNTLPRDRFAAASEISGQPAVLNIANRREDISPYLNQATDGQKTACRQQQEVAALLQTYYQQNNRKALLRAARIAPDNKTVLDYSGQTPVIYSWEIDPNPQRTESQ